VDREGQYVRPGTDGREKGKPSTPHGVCVDLRDGTPKLIVADLEPRIQVHPRGKFVSESFEDVESLHGDAGRDPIIPDPQGRVTI
jgi:hypothetical protein